MYETLQTKIAAEADATKVVPTIRAAYTQMKALTVLLARYQAGTDTVFIAAVNQLLTAQERADVGAILTKFQSLITDLEANNRQALGI